MPLMPSSAEERSNSGPLEPAAIPADAASSSSKAGCSSDDKPRSAAANISRVSAAAMSYMNAKTAPDNDIGHGHGPGTRVAFS
eukprot:scaffold71378_cov66-Phaeocystis_antarctica.AAC.2